LTTTEVAWEYNQGAPIAHWRLDEKDGLIAHNSSIKTVSTDGMVGYWPLESLSADDYSGYGNSLSLGAGSSAPTIATGAKGNALDFDGSNDYASAPDMGITEGKNYTVSFWANIGTGATNPAAYSEGTPADWSNNLFIIYYGDSGSSDGIRVWYRDSGGTGGSIITYSSSVADSSWHHVVLTQSAANNRKLYLDGVEVENDTTSRNVLSVSSSSIGAANSNGGYAQFFDGKIDNMKLYNRALSAGEVQAEYQSKQENFGALTNMDASTDWVSGKFNNALDFDGNNDHVVIASNPALTGFSKISVSFWVYADDSSATDGLVDKQRFQEWNMHIAVGKIRFEGLASGGTVRFTADNALPIGQWTHVVATYDGSTAGSGGKKIYYNGVEEPVTINVDSTGDITSNTNPIYLGRLHNGYYFNGKLDEVKIYNYALTSDQVKVDYNNSAAVGFR